MQKGQVLLRAGISWMRSLVFEGRSWQAYEKLREKDKRLHQSLCRLLSDMLRGDPTQGVGKPEALKHKLAGLWSRRISRHDRVVYAFDDECIYIYAIGGRLPRIG